MTGERKREMDVPTHYQALLSDIPTRCALDTGLLPLARQHLARARLPPIVAERCILACARPNLCFDIPVRKLQSSSSQRMTMDTHRIAIVDSLALRTPFQTRCGRGSGACGTVLVQVRRRDDSDMRQNRHDNRSCTDVIEDRHSGARSEDSPTERADLA